MRDDAVKDEKPLHVQVHEALGRGARWVPGVPGCDACKSTATRGWWEKTWDEHGEPDYGFDDVSGGAVPRYDEDWAATGPLISRIHIDLQYLFESKLWWAYHIETCTSFSDETSEAGGFETPLLAVCNLILALKAAGKLEDSGKDRGKEQG